MFSSYVHRKIFLVCTVILAAALPLSPFAVSVSHFLLIINWFAEPDFRSKISILIKRKSILLLISVYFVHVFWMLNTDNIATGIQDLKIKLPLIVLPLVYGTSAPLLKRELKYLYNAFLLSCLVAITISVSVYFGLTQIQVNDIRDISPIISHIRLSLLIVLATYLIIYLYLYTPETFIWPKFIYLVIVFIFLVFILWLGAFTGIVILLMVMPFAVILWLRNRKTKRNYLLGILIVFIITTSCLAYLYYTLHRFTSRNATKAEELPLLTANGNAYLNIIDSDEYENEFPIWVKVCETELLKEWDKRSSLDYRGHDLKGQSLSATLIRYMTSMGLSKDSVGISKLSNEDIWMIENGYTNYLFKNKWSVYPRLYQIYWEIEYYIEGGNPSGHSLTQRVEYLKNAIHVIKRHFWFGTGTGDTVQEIKKQYDIDQSPLHPMWRNRVHNQLVTFFLSFGLVGFLYIIAAVGLAIYYERKNIDFVFICYLLIFLFSTLNEDTLETQIGATYYAFFLSLFLLGRSINSNPKTNSSLSSSK